jgi:hypothetical protein
MDKSQIKAEFWDEIVELARLLGGSFPYAKYKYECYRNDLIWEYGYSTFFDIQSCAFEYLFS